MRSEEEANRAIDLYADTVRRIGMVYLKSHADMEDIFQTVFLKYILHDEAFLSETHEKAWLIRVTINACKDFRKSFFRSHTVSIEEAIQQSVPMEPEAKEVLSAVLALPKKYKDVVYLHYYEGYTAVEIGEILGKNVNTIYTLLARAKKQLKDILGGEQFA